MFIAGAGAIVLFAIIIFLREPKGQMAEVMPDGSVEMIDVS